MKLAIKAIEAKNDACRTPHGVRGLKYGLNEERVLEDARRTPHGVRGLKYYMRR